MKNRISMISYWNYTQNTWQSVNFCRSDPVDGEYVYASRHTYKNITPASYKRLDEVFFKYRDRVNVNLSSHYTNLFILFE